MAKIKKGEVRNPKGCPKGAHNEGRPTNEFKRICAEALDEVQGIQFAKSIIAGVKYPTSFGDMPARPETRMDAVKWLAANAHGTPTHSLEVSGQVDSRLIFVFEDDSDSKES